MIAASALLWQMPVDVRAASTGWDCITTPAGVYECAPAKVEPKPEPEIEPVIEAKPLEVEPESEPVPVEQAAPAEPAPEPPSEPQAEPQPEAPRVVESPEPPAQEPEPEPQPQKQVVETPEPAPEPAVTEQQQEPTKVVEPEPSVPERKQTPAVADKPAPQPEVASKEKPFNPFLKPTGKLHRDPQWELCGPAEQPQVPKNTPGGETSLTADDATLNKEAPSIFSGNVEIRQPGRALDADKVVYDRKKATVNASGNVFYRTDKLGLVGDSAFVDLEDGNSRFDAARFRLYDRHARGTAKSLTYNGKEKLALKGVNYTTCNAGNDDWYLKAKDIELNQETGVGTAKNVSVRFKDVPIFYSPVLTFPIDDRRKSGFLSPSFGNSDKNGVELAIPYYWNIAPNHDATITARSLARRGFQAKGEYRFLTEKTKGQVNLEYLPDDDAHNDDRELFSLKHKAVLAPRVTTDVDFNYVSDRDYFEDLGRDITVTSTTHLVKRADLRYNGTNIRALARVQGFQTLDSLIPNNQRPYERLPQLLLNGNWYNKFLGADYSVRAEAVHFERSNSVTGTRVDLLPAVSLPLRNSYGYIIPRVAVRHTRYDLDDSAANRDDNPDRTVPYYSVDAGLFFEREGSWGSTNYIQTLEPRLYYLNVPFRDQNNLVVDENGNSVVFDTTEFDFGFAQLFREDRFTGADRVGDANQLTAALTTRILEANSGRERFRASLGQIYYFRDRDVRLPNRIGGESSTSDIVAEIFTQFSNSLSAGAAYQYDTDDNETQRGTAFMRYKDKGRIVNLAYRFRRDFIEQTDASVVWPLTRQLNGIARFNYSLARNRTIDAFAGLEYESCCYVVRAIGRQFLSDLDGDENNAFLIQLELKGLTSLGDRVKDFLGKGILGYDSE